MTTRKITSSQTNELEKFIRPTSSAIAGFVDGLASTGTIDNTTARNVTKLTRDIADLTLGSSRTYDEDVKVLSFVAFGFCAMAGLIIGLLVKSNERELPKKKAY